MKCCGLVDCVTKYQLQFVCKDLWTSTFRGVFSLYHAMSETAKPIKHQLSAWLPFTLMIDQLSTRL